MQNEIIVNLTEEHQYECDCIIIARCNENKAAHLKIIVPDDLRDKWLYIDFEKANGEKVKTSRIIIDEFGDGYYEVCNNLTDVVGKLKVEMIFQDENNLVWKTFTKQYRVAEAICATNEIEQENPNFITDAQKILDDTEQLKEEVEEGLTPTIGENGNWFVLDVDTGKPSRGVDGQPGIPGQAGQDGFSPIVNTTQTSTGGIIEITDSEKTSTLELDNGIDGEPGKDGIDGIDGKDAKINGVNTLNIVNGTNSQVEQINDTLKINVVGIDNKVDKVNGKELSSNDFSDEYKTKLDGIEENANNYALPSDVVQDEYYNHTDNNYTSSEKSKLSSLSNYDDAEVKQDITNLETNKADKTEIPDVSNFITNSVDSLINYYLKSDTYTKSEVNNLIGQIQTVSIQVVNELPVTGESNIIYFVPKTGSENDVYNEYIWVNNDWELIGSTQVDLTGYATETWVNSQISNFLTSTQIQTLITNSLVNYYTKTETNNLLSNKQNTLIAGSNITITGNVINAEVKIPSTNTIFAMYFNNTNQTLLSEEVTAETSKGITLSTTEQHVDYTFSVPSDNFVINASSLYNLYLCLSDLSTVSGKKYTFKSEWLHGDTLISESSHTTFEATTSNELIGLPMPTNYLTENVALNIGDVLTLRIYYKTNYGDGTINILSGTGQQSSFVRNGSEVTANNVYDNFNGENHSQAYINSYLKNSKVNTSDLPNEVRSVRPLNSSSNPTTLALNTIYDLGTQTNLSLILPTGVLGDFIQVDFLSGDTSTTLTISSSSGLSDYDFVPDANMIYSMYFDWGRLEDSIYGWKISYSEYNKASV